MNTFGCFLLVMGHLVGDWIFQTEHQALNKAHGKFFNWPLIGHCLIYTACFIPIFAWLNFSWWWLILIFSSHMFLDRRWPVVWWIKHIKRTSDNTITNNFWLVIAVDQVMHLLIITIIVIAEL
ncbi:DUF3307 domain-containing protein [Candidatus Jorgensenbacteria bacterium]|nr:DUF3307 domain-containing protein [Candidatus Jorgensenbacteria bacterium]